MKNTICFIGPYAQKRKKVYGRVFGNGREIVTKVNCYFLVPERISLHRIFINRCCYHQTYYISVSYEDEVNGGKKPFYILVVILLDMRSVYSVRIIITRVRGKRRKKIGWCYLSGICR